MTGRLVLARTRFAKHSLRWHSSAASGERLRIAIVGGGAAGLSCALHLAPLVEQGLVASPIDVFEGGPPQKGYPSGTGAIGRDIGVGVWSTALKPLSKRPSFDLALENLTRSGKWVGEVGYKTPNGSWLAQSRLPSAHDDVDMPGLLFLRESDLLMALRQAVHLEERAGTVKIHWKKSGNSTHVNGIWKETRRFSAALSLNDDAPSERDYHLIVAADGMLSQLRQAYGGHRKKRHLTGAAALPSPFEKQGVVERATEASWEASGQAAANAIEDRNYTVFRGNSELTNDQVGMNGVSFQTWGEGKSMRFASVPLCYGSGAERVEKQVWFVTTSDDSIAAQQDATRRQEMLLSAFDDWHEPIPQLLEATPPEEILVERAVAHKHSVGPVLNVNQIISQTRQDSQSASGPGPALVFVGDAYMTVDPILAQGFTMAMESAYELGHSVSKSLNPSPEEPSLAFDPYALRTELKKRHDRRGQRLLCLLRATELVQSLGQPNSRTLSGLLSRRVVRPLMRVSPDFVKRPIFDSMLKYSLGVHSKK